VDSSQGLEVPTGYPCRASRTSSERESFIKCIFYTQGVEFPVPPVPTRWLTPHGRIVTPPRDIQYKRKEKREICRVKCGFTPQKSWREDSTCHHGREARTAYRDDGTTDGAQKNGSVERWAGRGLPLPPAEETSSHHSRGKGRISDGEAGARGGRHHDQEGLTRTYRMTGASAGMTKPQ
jgi:hypothetical protein